MRRGRENPDTGAWLVAGGVAVGVVGLIWFLTRGSPAAASTASSQAPAPPQPSTPGNYNTTYGPPLITVAPPPVRPDYQITAGQQPTVSLKVGQILAIAQPHPAGANQNWGIVITPAQPTPLFVVSDAAVQDLGWQSDYTDQVKPTAAGTATVTMNLYDDTHGQVVETYSTVILAS